MLPARPATATMTWPRSFSDTDVTISPTERQSVESGTTMVNKRSVQRFALMLAVLVTSSVLGSASAMAAELGDYRWERRPLLLFTPTDNDPRVAETLSRIEATRCDFDGRDMVIGVVVADGTSTLDGQILGADEAQQLFDQYAIGRNTFSALLIGKDGGEKLRISGVPDLQTIYGVIDGMPMRSREMGADPNRC